MRFLVNSTQVEAAIEKVEALLGQTGAVPAVEEAVRLAGQYMLETLIEKASGDVISLLAHAKDLYDRSKQ